eukprot:m.122223 g.122223  ORF g.122223 m.122223 type:complete len:305 (-) comp52113_c0_seq1:38-952(-)
MEDNPYELLQLEISATDAEVNRAYRKLALKYHPDKNPGDATAAAMFARLVTASKLLLDPVARAAFDNVYKLKKAAELRDQQLNAERRKAKEDLEARELGARKGRSDVVDAQRRLQAELQRLREETARFIEEEQIKLRQQNAVQAEAFQQMQESLTTSTDSPATLQLRWKTKDIPSENGGYSKAELTRLFRKYGPVDIVMSSKPGRALAAFTHRDDANFARAHESGIASNPFTRCRVVAGDDAVSDDEARRSATPPVTRIPPPPAKGPVRSEGGASIGVSEEEDFEARVLEAMLRAHSRQQAASP